MNRSHPPRTTSLESLRGPFFCLALLVALFLLPAFSLHPDALRFGGDVAQQFYPSKFFLRQCLLSGEFPRYNPYLFSGAPFLPTSSLYPPDLLMWLALPLKIGLWITQMAHLLWGALGMYLLVQRYTQDRAAALVSAVSFTFGSHFAARIFAGHLLMLESSVWLPWIVLCGEKALEPSRFTRWTFVTAALLALCLAAGSIEVAFMSGTALGLRFLWEFAPALKARDTARARVLLLNFSALLAVAVGLMGIVLLPMLEMIGLSARVDQGYEIIKDRSLPPVSLLTFLIPDLLGNAALRNTVQGSLSLESATYLGLASLLLGGFAAFVRRDRVVLFCVTLALFSLFVAMVGNTPLVRVLPGFTKLPAPYRFVFLWCFAVSVLAGFGAYTLNQDALDPKHLRRFLALVLGIAVAASVAALLYFLFREPILAQARRAILARYPDAGVRLIKLDGFYATQLRGLVLWAVLSALTGMLLVARSRGGARGRALFRYGVVALLVLDLGAQNQKYIRAMEPMSTDRAMGYEAFLARDPEPHRVLPLASAGIPHNALMLHGISSATGYESLILKSYYRYLEAMEGGPQGEIDRRAPILKNYRSPLVDRLNIKYVLSGKPITDADLSLVHQTPSVRVYRRKAFLPRARVVHRVERVAGDEAALARLARMPLNSSVALVTPDAPELTLRAAGTGEPVPRVTPGGPNRRTIRADLGAPGLLVLSEMYVPGWRATVDGREAPVLKTDYLFCGIALPEGKHTVVLEYAPASVRLGAAITGATLVGVVLLSLLILSRRRRLSPPR